MDNSQVSSLADSIGANGLVLSTTDFSLHKRLGPETYLHLLQIRHHTESLGGKGVMEQGTLVQENINK